MSLAKYGTAHEALEDEKNSAVSRRPTAIQDEIVTDEKGRRRFHGAFTGGFSAGYFNTVGSRHGWVPQNFKSSRDERPEEQKRSIHDFMDDEDRGEFGFAHQKIKTKSNFMAQMSEQSKNAPLAWERAGPSTSENFNDLAMTLASTFQGVNDSIGVKILKKMGWRPGKGIGPRMKRRQLERQKVNDARQLGHSSAYNKEDVEAMEELAPEAEYAPDDIPRLFLKSNEGEHGLGYRPLERSNVLEEDFLMKVDAYKEKVKSKGIRGQAFGVGAFEEDDDDVYANEDISKYDFAIGGEGDDIREVKRYETAFVSAEHSERPKFYRAPEPSRHFDPKHHPSPIILKDSIPELTQAFQSLNPLQKAVFLGDRTGSVLELLSSSDREKLKLLTKKAEIETKITRKEAAKRRADPEPFEEEPMKAHRFKKFVHYLKSGHEMTAPIEMTRLEWEEEIKQFENHLTPELRALLPSVRDRQQPLARLTTAQPIADQLKNRFRTETSASIKLEPTENSVEETRRLAVQQKQFGALTRQKFTWYPSKYMVKYFNVEDPYPESREEGCPDIVKKHLHKKDYNLDMLGLADTQKEVVDRIDREAHDNRRKSRWEASKEPPKPMDKVFEAPAPETEKPTFLPPISLLQAVFEHTSDGEESEQEEDEVIIEEPPKSSIKIERNGKNSSMNSTIDLTQEPSTSKPPERFVTVLDLVESDDEYGPKVPETLPTAPDSETKAKIVPVAPDVIEIEDSSSESDEEEEKHRKRKRRRRDSSMERSRKSKKNKKEKRKKEKKRRRRDS